MNRSYRLASVLALGVLAASGAPAALPPRANSANPAPATGASALTTSAIVVLGESVVVDVRGSLLATAVLVDGQRVRPIAARALFEIEGAHGLAESRVHVLRPAGGDAPLDLSVRGVDVTLHAAEAPVTPLLRDYAVRLAPAPGMSWGEVAGEEDLVLTATRL